MTEWKSPAGWADCTDRQIVSGPYNVAPTLGVNYAAPWVVDDIPVLSGLAENLYTWLGTLLNGLAGAPLRREVAVTIGDGGMPRESVAMDSWRRDSVLKSRPALNASPTLNRDPVEEARLDAEHDARMAEVDKQLKGSILGEVLGNYIDGDVFIAPAVDSWTYEIKPGEFTDAWAAIDLPTGTILDGLIRTLP